MQVIVVAMNRLLMLVATVLLVAGCASTNVNPSRAHAHTGYVDFHADALDELSWQVERFDERKQAFQRVFSELDPPAEPALRLAFPPGHYRFKVRFLNRVVSEPGLVDVEVKDGMITPVRVELIAAGESSVQVKRTNPGGTAYGRYGRRTRIRYEETAMYRVSTEAQPPVPFKSKAWTSYAR
jgi:hypothetical protein